MISVRSTMMAMEMIVKFVVLIGIVVQHEAAGVLIDGDFLDARDGREGLGDLA